MNMKNRLLAAMIFLLLVIPVAGFSETKEILSEGIYNMGDGETPIIAEEKAIEQAKKFALEEAGTYVKSYSKMKNFQIEDDEVQVLASGIMEVTLLDKKRSVTEEAIKFWVKIKAVVHPDRVEVMAEKIRDQGLAEDYAKMKSDYEKSQKEIEDLKKQLTSSKGETDRKEIVAKITEQEKTFVVNQWFETGMQHAFANRIDDAIASLSKAIEGDPNMQKAYGQRAALYARQQKFDLAIADFSKFIEMNPKVPRVYAGRGFAYSRSGDYEKAIADLNRAIEMEPDTPRFALARIYTALGHSYRAAGDMEKAKSSFQKACNLGNAMACRQLKAQDGEGRPGIRPFQRDKKRRVSE
jgi:tetratricopeptide (TPR) repeat protein